MKLEELYTSGEYLEKNPTWHVEESPWKAQQIIHMKKKLLIPPRVLFFSIHKDLAMRILGGYSLLVLAQ